MKEFVSYCRLNLNLLNGKLKIFILGTILSWFLDCFVKGGAKYFLETKNLESMSFVDNCRPKLNNLIEKIKPNKFLETITSTDSVLNINMNIFADHCKPDLNHLNEYLIKKLRTKHYWANFIDHCMLNLDPLIENLGAKSYTNSNQWHSDLCIFRPTSHNSLLLVFFFRKSDQQMSK